MAEKGDEELQKYFDTISFKLKRELATTIKEQADGLAAAIKAAAPVRTGRLRDSVKVRRGRNTLELVVTAGGDETTTEFNRSARYERDVRIDQDTKGITRGTAGGVTYDYSLAVEFGTHKMPAKPFFWSTYRAHRDDIQQAIEEKFAEVISKG